jgi:hypothetical protein
MCGVRFKLERHTQFLSNDTTTVLPSCGNDVAQLEGHGLQLLSQGRINGQLDKSCVSVGDIQELQCIWLIRPAISLRSPIDLLCDLQALNFHILLMHSNPIV